MSGYLCLLGVHKKIVCKLIFKTKYVLISPLSVEVQTTIRCVVLVTPLLSPLILFDNVTLQVKYIPQSCQNVIYASYKTKIHELYQWGLPLNF